MTQPDDTPMVTEAMLDAFEACPGDLDMVCQDYGMQARADLKARLTAALAASPPLAEGGRADAWRWMDCGIEFVVRGDQPHPAHAEPLFTRASLQGN